MTLVRDEHSGLHDGVVKDSSDMVTGCVLLFPKRGVFELKIWEVRGSRDLVQLTDIIESIIRSTNTRFSKKKKKETA